LKELSSQKKKKKRIWYVEYSEPALTAAEAARELARYKLDLVGEQQVRWDKGSTVRAGDYNFVKAFSYLH
jgi:hypothetical protein